MKWDRTALARVARLALPIALLGAAAWTIHTELRGFHFRDLRAGGAALPRAALGAAAAIAALDYLLLSAYDLLGLRYAGRALPYPRVLFTSFVSYAFGNNVGFAVLSSGSVRYRLYSQWGLSAVEIGKVVGFTAVTLWAGLLPLGGVALLAGAPVPLAPWAARALGAAALALTAGWLAAAARGRPVRIRGLEVAPPSLGLAAAQVVVSAIDWALAGAVLWALLPVEANLSFFALLGLFVAAQVAGLVSQVPGGVGVFESVILAAVTPAIPAPRALAVLVAYRAVYYVFPFVAAFVLLVAHEVLAGSERARKVLKGAHASFAPIVPWLAAAGSLLAGAVLLVSGATPSVASRLHAVREVLPVPIREASHLLGSLVGTGLLLLSRGLARRIDGAWITAVALLAAGAVASLAKGLDWEEATLLVVLLAALLPFRRQFYRKSSLLEEPFSAPWIAAIVAVLAGSLWIGWFSFRHVEWSSDLWFEFGRGDAPRFLRASVAALAAAALVGARRLLLPARPEPGRPTGADLARVRPIVLAAHESAAHLALVGDKPLLLSPGGDAFLMYGVEGRSWVAMGDPVGPEREATELAWRFRELSDRHGGWACFYQVGGSALGRYLDLGLALLKLGEEAVVPLEAFSLEGSERRALRQAHARAVREGLAFDVAPREAVPPLLPELRRVSDAWLAEKSTREKGFSLGYFDDRYLAEGPIALVRKDGALVAFANVWAPANPAEVSVDLMRYVPGAPRATMDFLFVSLMLWGREKGYGAFNLGMAPFSGFEERSLAPAWTKLGARLFRYGENFYNFQGVRQYKEKFAPEWRPRWLAAPGGLRLPVVLTNIAALVSRGLKGVVAR